MVSLVAVLFSLLFTREARRVGIVLASAVVMLIHGLESVNVVCCASCCAVDLDMHNRPSSHATRGRVSRTLSSSWDHVCCCSGPARWNFTPAMTAPITRSHHVVAQYSMWLLDARGCVGPISSARFGLAPCFRMQQERSLQVKRDAKAPPCCGIAFRLCHIIEFMKFCVRGMSCAVSFMIVEDAPTRRQSREACFFRSVSYACCTTEHRPCPSYTVSYPRFSVCVISLTSGRKHDRGEGERRQRAWPGCAHPLLQRLSCSAPTCRFRALGFVARTEHD